jgi:hypothetical protein
MDFIGTAASIVTVIGGAAGVIAWRRRHLPKTLLRPPVEAFEILPFGFIIDLFHLPPSVRVELYVINYTRRSLHLTQLTLGLYATGAPGLARLELVQEFPVPPRRSMLVVCTRHLADTEARAIALPINAMPVSGSVDFVARAKSGGREYTVRTDNRLRIEGGIHPPAG